MVCSMAFGGCQLVHAGQIVWNYSVKVFGINKQWHIFVNWLALAISDTFLTIAFRTGTRGERSVYRTCGQALGGGVPPPPSKDLSYSQFRSECRSLPAISSWRLTQRDLMQSSVTCCSKLINPDLAAISCLIMLLEHFVGSSTMLCAEALEV